MRSLKHTAIAVAATAALLTPGIALARQARVSRTQVVAIRNIAFLPKKIGIKRGDTVTWQFLDAPIDTQHTVTSYGRLRFRGSVAMLRGSYSVRFTRPGVYLFHCTIHPNMEGRVVVRG